MTSVPKLGLYSGKITKSAFIGSVTAEEGGRGRRRAPLTVNRDRRIARAKLSESEIRKYKVLFDSRKVRNCDIRDNKVIWSIDNVGYSRRERSDGKPSATPFRFIG